MVKVLLNLRLEREKREALKRIAQQQGIKPTDIIRSKIDEVITNGTSPEVKQRAANIVKELRGSFVYVKNKVGTTRAIRERSIREVLAAKIERAFCL